jgi:hypothetical protein
VGGGAEAPGLGLGQPRAWDAAVMERLGVATAADVQPDSLAERLLDDVRASDGIVIEAPLISAWARTR